MGNKLSMMFKKGKKPSDGQSTTVEDSTENSSPNIDNDEP